MHIPTLMLSGAVCAATAAASATGIGLTAFRSHKSAGTTAGEFAGVTALIFAAQMLNFPISGGTSGHLIGGVLAASLLGIPLAVLSLALVLAVQCLVFADGGLAELGANIFNMAILGAGVGGMIRLHLTEHRGLPGMPATGIAAWCSVMLATIACSAELALAGTIPFGRVIASMLGVHAVIGLGEAALTCAALALIQQFAAPSPHRSRPAALALGAVLLAVVLAPFASGLPDGLEFVADKFQFLHDSMPLFVSPLADYSVPQIQSPKFATAAAGMIGTVASFALAMIAFRSVGAPRTAKVEKE